MSARRETVFYAGLYNENRAQVDSTPHVESESIARSHGRALAMKYGMKTRHDGWYVRLEMVTREIEVVAVHMESLELLAGTPPEDPEFVPPKYQDH